VVRTLLRLVVTRRRMLEWVSAAQVKSSLTLDLGRTYLEMWGALVLALVAGTVAVFSTGEIRPIAATFAVLWCLSPAVARWISRPAVTGQPEQLSGDERQRILATARKSWRFFETFVTQEDNSLPPDNFQDDPRPAVAHRTSPTNLGVYLLSPVAARASVSRPRACAAPRALGGAARCPPSRARRSTSCAARWPRSLPRPPRGRVDFARSRPRFGDSATGQRRSPPTREPKRSCGRRSRRRRSRPMAVISTHSRRGSRGSTPFAAPCRPTAWVRARSRDCSTLRPCSATCRISPARRRARSPSGRSNRRARRAASSNGAAPRRPSRRSRARREPPRAC